jgi:hypothetical protein
MPVEFEAYDPSRGRIDLSEGTNAERILVFLVNHPDLGFTPREIHEETGVARGSVGPTLRRLADHGLVRHKGDYWAAAAEDRLATIASTAMSMDAVGELLGDDWYGRNPDWADDLPDLGEREGEPSTDAEE